jgi:hypothetical protein
VSLAALVPLVIFAVWWMVDQKSGGYKAVKLEADETGRPVEVAHVEGAAPVEAGAE